MNRNIDDKKNLIFGALAFIENYESNPDMTQAVNEYKGYEVYIKNAVVSLVSAKQHNLDTDVALVTNIQLEEKWKKIFKKNGIIIFECSYENFCMSADVKYSLSYYKLCAFDYILKNTNYDRFCFLDCDTYCVNNFENIWLEVDDAFLVVPNDSSLNERIRKELIQIYGKINGGVSQKIVHVNSALIVGTRTELVDIINRCESIYNKLIQINDIKPEGGDEVIWSLALADYKGKIHSPKAYILLANIGLYEYWVDKKYYEDEDIIIWHLPSEKRYAMIWAYNKFEQTNKVPNMKQMAKACRIRKIYNRFTLLSIRAILLDKTVIKRNLKKLRRNFSG